MMISPETFYDEYLKGKSEREILAVIRGLKQKIGRLKNIMEHPDYVQTICPGEDVQISCCRMYLERAKQALAEVGGTYTLSDAEFRVERINASLPHIFKVEFSINGYSTGYEEKTYFIDGDKVTTTTDRAYYNTPPEPLDFEDEEMNKDTLIEGLADLHIGEWRTEYDPSRFDIAICDGVSWYLNIYFSNGHRPVKIDGCNAYPYNFERLLELFDIQLFSMEDLKSQVLRMKAKCIKKSSVSLTENKIYDVISVEKDCFRIIDDTGEDYLFPSEYFVIIDVVSDQKTIYEKWEDSEISILPEFTNKEMKLIKKALTEVVTRRVEKVKPLPDASVPLSDEFNQKMQDLINERKEQKKLHLDVEDLK